MQIETTKRQQMIDITDEINQEISKAKIKNGLCNVFCLHTSAAVVINENWDPNIQEDFFNVVNKLIPDKAGYKHDSVDGNTQSHILSTMLGPSETIPIKNGKLILGQWQAVMFVELDGPRSRQVEIKIIES